MKKIILILPITILILSGCIVKIKTSGNMDGGVYKTQDKGENWGQVTLVYRVGELEKNFKLIDVTAMTMDSTDNQAIYIGTAEEGIYYTYNGGVGWHQALKGKGRVNAIAVSPKERCIIYAAIDNRVYKTTDCSRHWNYQLIESRSDPNNAITAIAIDAYDTQVIYVGTSGKGLFKSEDGGYSWHVVKFFDSRINKILINQNDSRIIYAATDLKGIFKTKDQGENWEQLFSKEMLKDKKNLLTYREFILDPSSEIEAGLLYASDYGLIRTKDGGATWEDIELLTPKSTAVIYSIGINPKNGKEIYYATNKTLYRSEDGGLNWITRSLPSGRAAKYLLIDPEDPKVLYIGVKTVN